MKHSIFALGFLSAVMFGSTQSYSSWAVCGELGGGVIFKDTLYGLGTGLVITGLALGATKDDQDIGQKLAAGSLIGSGIGFTVGIVEMFARDCQSRQEPLTPGWQTPNVFTKSAMEAGGREGFGLNWKYVLK